MSFFDRLERIRGNKTISGFMRSVGCASRQHLDWKRGSVPDIRTIERVAGFLSIQPCWLLWGTGPKTKEEAEAVEKYLKERRKEKKNNG